uniref:Uncharacterized protein n=1 Tax=Anguilla anguilla TaxID=7936 RepID=A0A0E9V0L3_ANGAN
MEMSLLCVLCVSMGRAK